MDGRRQRFGRPTHANTYVTATNGSDFRVGESLDFNGDGHSDHLVRESEGTFLVETGAAEGAGFRAGYQDGSVAPVWSIAAVGDLNGDGKAGILWRNIATGEFTNVFLGTDACSGSYCRIGGHDPKSALVFRTGAGAVTGWFLKSLAMLIALSAPAVTRAEAAPPWATVPDVPPLPAPAMSGFVDRGGAHIYFAVFNRGGGRPVVLLHGGFASSDSWGFEVPRLAAGHEVIVIDSRGHGRSTMPAGPLGYGEMSADVIAVLDRLRIAKASVVGLSDGGIVGLLLAIHDPERVDRLFVWGATFNTHADSDTPPDPAMAGMGARFMARMEANYRAVSPTPDGFPALKAALNRLYAIEPDLTPAELDGIRARTVVADGAHEQFIARSHTETLARLIPGAKLLILPDVSHGGPQQNPIAFHEAVSALLDR